jgi:uncharacterized SAM-binding protein YcdF (DUF218 family)
MAELEPLDPAFVAAVNRDHLITTPLTPADLLFVFGTRHGVDEFVADIARLWRDGYFRWVLVSGGPTLGDPVDEASVISRAMIAAGVPAEIILTEHAATNTGENVIFSLPILEARLGLANVRSLIALGKVCTSIRYLMTLERHWPQVRKMLWPVNYFGHPVGDWPHHPLARGRVLAEVAKIGPYKARGFIVDWPGIRHAHPRAGLPT